MEIDQPSHFRRLAQAATLVTILYVLGRALSLPSDILITNQFGTSRELDAYFAAFKLPDLIFNLIASGALASAFIPLFSSILAQGEKQRSWQFASHIVNLVLLVMTSAALLAALFAEPIVQTVIAPGFSPEYQRLTANLMRLMLITPVVFGVSGIVTAILNSYHHFLLPALAPIMYNLGIIGGALFLAPNPAFGVYGLAIGVVAGACLHLLIQVPWLVRAQMVYLPALGLHDQNVREVVRLMLPRILGTSVWQLNTIVNTVLASTLPAGRLAAFSYALALLLLPEGVIAQSIATVLFPTLSQFAARGERTALRQAFSAGLRVTLFLTIPASIGLMFLGSPIIQLLFQRGEFTADSTFQTAFALQFYAVGLFAFSGLEIITRAFYALQDTATPVQVGIAAFLLNIVLSVLLLQPLQQGGLALANSLATVVEMLTLLYLLRARMGGIEGARLVSSLARVAMGSAVMGLALVLLLGSPLNSNPWLITVAGVALGTVVFFGTTLVLRSEELMLAWRLFRRRG